MPPWVYLTGRIGHAVLVALLLVTIALTAGALLFGVSIPGRTMPAFLAALAVGAMTFSALGLAITAAIPNADAAPAVVNASILPLLFFSDVFFSLEGAPSWLTTFSDFFPVRHFSQALIEAFVPGTEGSAFAPEHLLVMAAWGVAGALLAARFFRWEPRR